MSRKLIVALLALATALAGLTGHTIPLAAQTQPSGWSERAPMLLPRSEMSIAELEGRIFAIGGYPGARVTATEVQVYDSVTDSWSLGPALPLPLHHTMAAVADGRLYLIGGEAGDPVPGAAGFQDAMYMLDETTGQWLPRAPMPTARSGGGAAVIDGKIYVAGGRPPRGADFAVYDPRADTWTTLPDLPTARNHLAVAAIGGRVYVAGGRFDAGVGSPMTDLLEIFDPATASWTAAAPLPAPRAGVAAVAANGCLFVIGGEGNDLDPRGTFDRNEAYDPASNSWQNLAPLPIPVHGHTGAAFLNGWIHLPGGATRRGVSGTAVTVAHQVFHVELTCGPSSS